MVNPTPTPNRTPNDLQSAPGVARPLLWLNRFIFSRAPKGRAGLVAAKIVAGIFLLLPANLILGIPTGIALLVAKKPRAADPVAVGLPPPERPIATPIVSGLPSPHLNAVSEERGPPTEAAKDLPLPAPVKHTVSTTPTPSTQSVQFTALPVVHQHSPHLQLSLQNAKATPAPKGLSSRAQGKLEEEEDLRSDIGDSCSDGDDLDVEERASSSSSSSTSSDSEVENQQTHAVRLALRSSRADQKPLLMRSRGSQAPLHEIATTQTTRVEQVGKTQQKGKSLFERTLIITRPRGEVIVHGLKNAKNEIFAHDRAERGHTVVGLNKSIEQQLRQIENLEKEPLDPKKQSELKALKVQLNDQKIMLDKLLKENPEATWVSTDGPRAHFLFAKEFFSSIVKGFFQFSDNINDLIEAKKHALPLLGNLRHQAIYTKAGDSLNGYGDARLPDMLEQRSSEGAVFDTDVLERYNLFKELEKNTSIQELEKDLGYRAQIAALKKQHKFESGVTSAALKVAMDRMPISYFVKEGKGINRSAAISDFMHGETNLENIWICQTLLGGKATWDNLTGDERVRIKGLYPKIVNKQSNFDEHEAKVVLHNLKKEMLKAYPEKDLKGKSDAEFLVALNLMMSEREAHLMEKALQDLSLHLENQPLDPQQKSLFFGRIGLVDMTKKAAKDPGGFVLNERNQALDSSHVYRLLQGKELVFDLDERATPMRDLKDPNKIHLPKRFKKGTKGTSTEPVKLHTSYVNISIAGNIKNVDEQNMINREGIANLESAMSQIPLSDVDTQKAQILIGNLKENLKKEVKGGNFGVVADATELMRLLGFVSENCYGGKDRTGYVMAVNQNRIVVEHLQKQDPDSKATEEFTQILGKQFLEEGSVLMQGIGDNGKEGMKLDRTEDLDLIFGGGLLEGLGIYTKNLGNIVKGFLPGFIQSFRKMAGTGAQKGEGDLYQRK